MARQALGLSYIAYLLRIRNSTMRRASFRSSILEYALQIICVVRKRKISIFLLLTILDYKQYTRAQLILFESHTPTLVHLPQNELVDEKIFDALPKRKKPRDFYDLYFMMRKGMLNPDQKKRLSELKDSIILDAKSINFRGELGAFLPADQQAIINDFNRALESEINRQVV